MRANIIMPLAQLIKVLVIAFLLGTVIGGVLFLKFKKYSKWKNKKHKM